jgi:hypothetical protein
MRAVQTRSRLERRAGSCPRALGEFVAQDHGPVRQPAVRGPEGIGERVESVASLPELVELGVHPIKGVVLVMGAALELLSPTIRKP